MATIQDVLALAQRQQQAGQSDQAEAIYRRVLDFDPAQAEALFALGVLCLTAGRPAEAADFLNRASSVVPGQAGIFLYLSLARLNLDLLEAALGAVETASALDPSFPPVTSTRDSVLDSLFVHAERDFAANRLSRAIARMRHVTRHRPAGSAGLARLGCYLTQAGELPEAIEKLRRAVELAPDDRGTLRDLVLALNLLEGTTTDEQLAVRRRYDECFMRPLARQAATPASRRSSGRLRIGYVTGEFIRAHTACDMLIPLFGGHDRERVDLFVYTDVAKEREDDVTHTVRGLVPGWRSTAGLSDADMAEVIRADGIDVLIDAIGYSDACRLGVFARQPATIQVNMTLMGPSGLDSAPYVITDKWMSPPETAGDYSEKFILVPSLYLYRPMVALSPASSLPSQARGHVTFGCFNQLAKMSDRTLALWARILHAVPGSRLLLKAYALADEGIRQRCHDRFAAHGIAAERVELRAWTGDFLQHMRAYDEIDIALDPLPYGGGTTTREALWMGVPVVTLPGATAVQRYGLSILSVIGLSEGIARDEPDYLARTVAFATDLGALARLRADLRGRMERSALCDGALFARTIEAEFRKLLG
ncbi:MAG: tetratricopeptide repeat protein [Alphaproteobacteria bacterium]|nr:tetratricopeptide repeat protein [Alphaproteobacteria bacterium]